MTNPLIALPPPKKMPYLGMMLLQAGDCPYFEDHRPTITAIAAPQPLTNKEFGQTLEAGMRRSGCLVYRPICNGCRKCFPLRIKVADFQPTPSQTRVLKRGGSQFAAEFDDAALTLEKVELYRRYQAAKHNEVLSSEEATEIYERFLVQSCTQTKELRWRTKQGKLVGVGVLDLTDDALSSVYFFWDPDFAAFSLGTFSVVQEINLAHTLGLSHYYLGYFVPGSASMEYKIHFGPAEIWNGRSWEPLASKDVLEPATYVQLSGVEKGNIKEDAKRFDLTKSFQFEKMNAAK